MKYGLQRKQLSMKEIEDLVSLAHALGVDHIDTARGYGDSEAMLGHYSNLLGNKLIITKLSLRGVHDTNDIISHLKDSLRKMNLSKVHCVLLHDTAACIAEGSVRKLFVASMELALRLGLIETYGFSVYESVEIESLLKLKVPILNLQVPENVLDRRLKDSVALLNLRERGCTIYVRSLFLQGLLLNSSRNASLNTNNDFADLLRAFQFLCEELCLSPQVVALQYFHSLTWASYAVLGCESSHQLRENFEALNSTRLSLEIFSSLPQLPAHLVDPRNWNFV